MDGCIESVMHLYMIYTLPLFSDELEVAVADEARVQIKLDLIDRLH